MKNSKIRSSRLILEGLENGDLEEMVLPIINIDEFEPKSGMVEEIIVVGFYTRDEMCADDLSDFLERGHTRVLDTEASPNPDEHGFYLVFVEIERDRFFIDRLFKVIDDVERVSGPLEWKMKPYLADRIMELSVDNIKENVILNKKNYMSKGEYMKLKAKKDNIAEFLRNSVVEHFEIDTLGESIQIGNNADLTFEVSDFGNYKKLFSKYGIRESAIDLNYSTRAIGVVRNQLGPGWSVLPLNEFFVISNEDTDDVLLLKRPRDV